VLDVITAKRPTRLPDVPTIAETGVPGYSFESWLAFVVPTGVPPAIVAKLNSEIAKIVDSDSDSTQQLFAGNVITPRELSSADSQQVVEADYEGMGRLVKEPGAVIN
jgi:tripartite-type tricarboxylate transporter receptor subunit TctC